MHCVSLDYILVPNYDQLQGFPGDSGKEPGTSFLSVFEEQQGTV